MMKSGISAITVFLMVLANNLVVMAAPIIINGDFSDPVDLAGFTATGAVISEPTGHFVQLETDGTFPRTIEQTFAIPNLPILFSFDFAFSTEATVPVTGFPDSFSAGITTTLDGDFLDILVVDVYGVWEDPSEGIEDLTGATPIDVAYDPSVTMAGFVPFGGTTFYGRTSLWLPNEVLGEEATLYFDLFDELDGFKTIAAVDNISAAPIPEPGTLMLLAAGLLGMAGGFWQRKSLSKRGRR
jgi:hypothetical protein